METTNKPGFFAELKRRNVLRAAVLYIGAVWALSQGISQLSGPFGLANWVTVWFVIACAIGFPFWLVFAWFYELTPHGFRRDAEIAADAPLRHSNARKLDFAIIGVMAVAIVLLASGYFIRRQAPDAVVVSAKSIAVLPFENLSDDRKNEYFVAGMQDLILTKLADIGGLKVISRTSTAKYASHPEDLKTVGQQLGVATILEGSVQKAGNEVLINVQLIDAKTDNHIWAKDYTRTLTNVFGVEGEVAQQIATSLDAKLSPAQSAELAAVPTTNRAAYDAFLRAEYQADQGLTNYATANWKAAIPLYRQAVTADPNFALAWARMSYNESQLAWFGGGGEDVKQLNAQARTDADQALKLAPNLAASQIALGYCDYWGREDYAAALKAFGAALKLKPNDANALAAQGYVERRQGRFDAAIASFQQASTLDPRNSALAFELGLTYNMASRYSEAGNAFQRALAIDPHNLNAKVQYANAILFGNGDIPRALVEVQGDATQLMLARYPLLVYQRKYPEALAVLDSIPDTPDNFPPPTFKDELEADLLYWGMGDTARARLLFAKALPLAQAQLKVQQGIELAQVWEAIADDQIGLGHAAQGLVAVARAQAIVDKFPDQIYGPGSTQIDASMYAEAGRADLAVPLLAKSLTMPGLGAHYSPVLLWLDPAWDPIRNDPAFQSLLKQYAKYKPAVTYPIPPASAASTAAATARASSSAVH